MLKCVFVFSQEIYLVSLLTLVPQAWPRPSVNGVESRNEEEETEEVEDEGQGGKREEGDEEEEEEEEEDVVWLLGRAHDGPRTRDREGSEWPPDF